MEELPSQGRILVFGGGYILEFESNNTIDSFPFTRLPFDITLLRRLPSNDIECILLHT